MSSGTFLHFIDNHFVPATSEWQVEKRSPVDGSLVGSVAEGGPGQVDAAVQTATVALQGSWADDLA